MKFNGWLFLVAVMLGAAAGCVSQVSTRGEKNMAQNTTESIGDLERLSGLELPKAAKVISKTAEGGHDGAKFKKWIVSSSARFQLLGTVIDGDENQTFLETIKQAVPDEALGKPVGGQYQFSDWKNERGQWQAGMIETDRGFYLSLENIVLE